MESLGKKVGLVKVEEICNKRLAEWGKILVERHSTPFLIMGIGHDNKCGEIHMCISEGFDRVAAAELLRGAADKLDPLNKGD